MLIPDLEEECCLSLVKISKIHPITGHEGPEVE